MRKKIGIDTITIPWQKYLVSILRYPSKNPDHELISTFVLRIFLGFFDICPVSTLFPVVSVLDIFFFFFEGGGIFGHSFSDNPNF